MTTEAGSRDVIIRVGQLGVRARGGNWKHRPQVCDRCGGLAVCWIARWYPGAEKPLYVYSCLEHLTEDERLAYVTKRFSRIAL